MNNNEDHVNSKIDLPEEIACEIKKSKIKAYRRDLENYSNRAILFKNVNKKMFDFYKNQINQTIENICHLV